MNKKIKITMMVATLLIVLISGMSLVYGYRDRGVVGTANVANGASNEVGFGNLRVFDNAGEYLFVVPSGVDRVMIEVWGGGGSGAKIEANGDVGYFLGGGGSYGKGIYDVDAGEDYRVVVGDGGYFEDIREGKGGTSAFGDLDSWIIRAKGGKSGISSSRGGRADHKGKNWEFFEIEGEEGFGFCGGSGANGGSGQCYDLDGDASREAQSPGGAGVEGSGAEGRVVIWW